MRVSGTRTAAPSGVSGLDVGDQPSQPEHHDRHHPRPRPPARGAQHDGARGQSRGSAVCRHGPRRRLRSRSARTGRRDGRQAARCRDPGRCRQRRVSSGSAATTPKAMPAWPTDPRAHTTAPPETRPRSKPRSSCCGAPATADRSSWPVNSAWSPPPSDGCCAATRPTAERDRPDHRYSRAAATLRDPL
jgi:hypothetical protein